MSVLVAALVAAVLGQAPAGEEALARHRNLGKAFYENPTTQQRAVDEFKAALDLAPGSARERVNYGMALLRAGRVADGIAELERAQSQDPSIPHTWFNLGIAFKKDAQYERAVVQFERMVALVPGEAVSHYNLGYLYRLTDRTEEAIRQFEMSARLDSNLAGPHYQLYTAYRAAGRENDAAREQTLFQDLRRRQAGAAVPEDLDWSYYAEVFDPADRQVGLDPAPPAAVRYSAQTVPGRFDPTRSGLTVVDVDADGTPDLVAWSGAHVAVYGRASSLIESAGFDAPADIRDVVPGDFNNDGAPDLCVITAAGAVLYENAQGRFRRSAATLPSGNFTVAVWLDYDHDYDLDLVLLGGSSVLLRNNGRAGWSEQVQDIPFAPGQAVGAVAFPSVPDQPGMDLLVTYRDAPTVLYKDGLGGRYDAHVLESMARDLRALHAEDLDFDRALDVVGTGAGGVAVELNRGEQWERVPSAQATRVVALADIENRALSDVMTDGAVLHNEGGGRFQRVPVPALADTLALVTADFDGDGRVDAAAIRDDGGLHLLRNETATPHRGLRLALTGVRNLRRAQGALVEVKAGVRYQKKVYDGAPLHFGLRDSDHVDTVRITWPNGLIQNEIDQQAGRLLNVREAQRLSGSCPMIFTWDGTTHRFITDVLGVAPLGASAGDGSYFPVDHDEYVQIPGDALVARGGRFDIRMTEELREVSYIDAVQLMAVDHPAATDIFTNDKFKSPPFPEFRLFGGARGARAYPVRAHDERGQDVRASLLARDGAYAATFQRDYAGVAARHTLDLDFGLQAADNRAVIVLNGWVDWADGSTFLGAAQEDGTGLLFPSIQVKDRNGRWQTVIEDMGIPAGKPKTIAVDLTGKFLSASREVRIVTNLCLYWDEIFLLTDSAPPNARLTASRASSATLAFRGFSAANIHPERMQPESFDYERVFSQSMWNPTPGLYTRYGDVEELASAVDDRLVIMGSGDELALEFDVSAFPPLPNGWRRDYLLLVDGWAKDADANTAFGRTVEPLPFHAMRSYPYGPDERFPDDEAHREYRRRMNTRPALRLLRPLTAATGACRSSWPVAERTRAIC